MLPKVVLALSLILCVFLWSGPFAYAGGWGSGGGGVGHGGGQNTLEYNLFEGDVVGLIELEGIQLTASAANADPGILDRLAVWISSWYSSAKNFIKGAFKAPPELQDQSKINIIVDVVVEPPLGTPPQIQFPLMAGEGFIAVHKLLQNIAPNNKWDLDNVVKGSVTIDEAVGILHNKPFLKAGNWSGIVDILKPGNEYSMNEAYTELVRAAVIVRAAEINKSLLKELK